MNWNEIAAVLLNGVIVMVAVQGLKAYVLPYLKEKVPWTLPVLAQVVAYGVTYASNFLTAQLGFPVDLSPIAAVFTGLLAVGAFDMLKGGKFLK